VESNIFFQETRFCFYIDGYCAVVSRCSHGEIIFSGVESQRYFYLRLLSTVSFSRRMDGRVKSWRLRDWFQRSSLPVIFFSPQLFSVLEIVFLFSLFFLEEVTNSLFDRTCVCVCQCCVCIHENRKKFVLKLLFTTMEISTKHRNPTVIIAAQHPVDTYACRLQTSPNAYVILISKPASTDTL